MARPPPVAPAGMRARPTAADAQRVVHRRRTAVAGAVLIAAVVTGALSQGPADSAAESSPALLVPFTYSAPSGASCTTVMRAGPEADRGVAAVVAMILQDLDVARVEAEALARVARMSGERVWESGVGDDGRSLDFRFHIGVREVVRARLVERLARFGYPSWASPLRDLSARTECRDRAPEP